jgi:hypothetical protein
MMKTAIRLFALLVAPLGCNASDISDLASGYASAFAAMDRMTVNLTYVEDGKPRVLGDVKQVRAFGGTLLVKLTNGEQMVLSAGSVTRITQ